MGRLSACLARLGEPVLVGAASLSLFKRRMNGFVSLQSVSGDGAPDIAGRIELAKPDNAVARAMVDLPIIPQGALRRLETRAP
jgi:hypothetical protein